MKNRIIEDLRNFCKDEKLLVIAHYDLDGICSSVLMKKFLEKEKVKFKIRFLKTDQLNNLEKFCKDYKKIIALDIPISFLKKLKKKVFLIDHHPIEKIPKNFFVFNPMLESKKYQPTSYLVYKIFEKEEWLKYFEWVSALGCLADYGYEDCKDLMEKYVKIKEKKNLIRSKLGKVSKILNSAIILKGSEFVFEKLCNSKGIKNVLDKETLNLYKKFENKLNRTFKDCLKNLKFNKKAIFCFLKGKEGLASIIAKRISLKFEGKAVFVFLEYNNKIKISARQQKELFDLGKLMKNCSKGIGYGGGHKNAASAIIKKDGLEKFKKRLILLTT